MKKKLLVFLSGPLLFGSFSLIAQNWVNGGNALSANGTLGTTSNFSFLFKTNNTERGRVTNGGLWGFGTTAPNSVVNINGVGAQVPLRVQANGSTKFLVHNEGGVAIGGNTVPPVNGLFVTGNTGMGTAAPENKLHVFSGSAGTVTGYFQAPLIVENSTHCYINILAPDAAETGILFGKPASNVDGGIIYNNITNPNSLQFRTNGNITRMMLTQSGNLGVGSDPGFFRLRVRETGNGGGLCIDSDNARGFWELSDQDNLILFFGNRLVGSFNSVNGSYSALSDGRLKTNIKPMNSMIEKIMQLKPSVYQFKNAKDGQEYSGFIAQDVMKVFPSIVTHNVFPARRVDVYTMDYSQFGVLAIKGIQELQPVIAEQKIINEKQRLVNQEQQLLIEEQKLKIVTLEDRLAKLEAAFSNGGANKIENVPAAITNPSLEQNQPNPFNKNTTILYHIPHGSKGQINIYDQTGKIVKMLGANESGRSELSGYNLAPGVYTYTLLVNGKAGLSRQMLVIK